MIDFSVRNSYYKTFVTFTSNSITSRTCFNSKNAFTEHLILKKQITENKGFAIVTVLELHFQSEFTLSDDNTMKSVAFSTFEYSASDD